MDRVLAFPGGTVPAEAVTWRFDPSGGPGGQHANRSSTRVEAVLDLTTAGDVVPAARERLIDRFGAELRVVVDDTRSQARNRDIALDRLQARLRDGVAVTKPAEAGPARRGGLADVASTRSASGRRPSGAEAASTGPASTASRVNHPGGPAPRAPTRMRVPLAAARVVSQCRNQKVD